MTRDDADLSSLRKEAYGFAPSRSLSGAIIVLLVILAYFPSLHGGFVWDDDIQITSDPALRSLNGLRDIWLKPGATFQYYPLTFSGFWLGYQLWGLNPLGYHLLTLLFHVSAALLLWQLLAHLNVRGAWLAAAIFALHPVNAMSVAWISEFKNTLSATLALASAWAFLRFARLGVYAAGNNKSRPGARGVPLLESGDWHLYAVALFLFVLAMLAKTAVSFVPVSLLLVTWWQRRRLGWREIWPMLPMLAPVVILGAITTRIEQHGESGDQLNLGFLERVLISGRSFWFYLGKLFWPHPLSAIYERWTVNAHVGWQYLFPLATVALLLGLWWWRVRIGRGPLVAVLHFYVCTSLLILIVVPDFTLYSFVSDHWQYFGCMSVFALAAAGITRMLGFVSGQNQEMRAGVCSVLLLVLGTLTWQQASLYRDDQAFWRGALDENEKAWNAHVALGRDLYNAGQLDEAMVHYRRAIELNPGFAMAHFNYATTLWLSGRLDEAAAEFREAIRLRPNYYPAHASYCDLLLKQSQLGEAEKEVRQLLRIEPDSPVSLYHYGDWLGLSGKFDEANEQLTKAILLDPDYFPPRLARARFLRDQGRLSEAVQEYQSILQQSPGSARGRLGLAETFRRLGRSDQAIPIFRDLLRANPDDAEAGNNLAWILAADPDTQIRNGPEALVLAQHACKLTNEEQPSYLGTLAAAYAETGDFKNAIATAEKSRDLARRTGQENLAQKIERMLKSFRAGQPWRETAAAN